MLLARWEGRKSCKVIQNSCVFWWIYVCVQLCCKNTLWDIRLNLLADGDLSVYIFKKCYETYQKKCLSDNWHYLLLCVYQLHILMTINMELERGPQTVFSRPVIRIMYEDTVVATAGVGPQRHKCNLRLRTPRHRIVRCCVFVLLDKNTTRHNNLLLRHYDVGWEHHNDNIGFVDC